MFSGCQNACQIFSECQIVSVREREKEIERERERERKRMPANAKVYVRYSENAKMYL